MNFLRLLVDPPAAGAWNMAADEALWRSAEAGAATLRFYRWSEPTLSLGYFQEARERAQLPQAAACPVVRRASGGGALLHDQELTYSLALPLAWLASSPIRELTGLYGVAHYALVELLAKRGLQAMLAGCESNRNAEPFLCFARRTACDVVLGGAKICGSAQRRSRAAVLQHGGLLLACSRFAPELPGLAELGWPEAASPAAIDALITAWANGIAQALSAELAPSSLTAEERLATEEIVRTRFAAGDWTFRR